MKITERRVRPEQEYDAVVGVQCDICKRTFNEDWGADTYEVRETEVSMETGTHFPGSLSTKMVEFHICPQCFRERLIPALLEMGATPTERGC